MCQSPANLTGQVGLLSVWTCVDVDAGQEWFRDPGFIHSVLLSGLAPDTAYYYQFGNDVDGWSQVYQFNSA
jgi:hypothetical protein